MGTREPTADELRLAELAYTGMIEASWPLMKDDYVSIEDYRRMNAWERQGQELRNAWIAVVRAIIDGMRPMTERQWEDLPGLGKPWRDLSSREVWECFLESLSPKIIPDLPAPPPPPEYPEPGDRTCDKVVNESFPAARCILKLGHAGACDDGIPF